MLDRRHGDVHEAGVEGDRSTSSPGAVNRSATRVALARVPPFYHPGMIEEPTFKVDFHTSTGHTVTLTYTAAAIRSHPHPYVRAAAESGDRDGLWQALERMLMWTFEPEANGRDRPTRIVDDEGRVWVVRSGGVVAVTITEQGATERRRDVGFGPPTT